MPAGPTTAAALGTATLEYDGKTITLPIVKGSEGEVGIDIRQLRARTGLVTLDPGFGNTGACRSAITFIDGERGILRHRGYPIEDLAASSSFLEVAWLLMMGELPTADELDAFKRSVAHHTMLHEDFKRFFESLPHDAHPMPVCSAAVGALTTFYQGPEADNGHGIGETAARLIAKMPTLAAYSYKYSRRQPFIYPQNSLDYCANFLHMMFATPCEDYEVNPVLARALELLLILHADHEQNCSTSTVRVVGSSRANLYASISSGIGALWGPLHGGANQQVIEMLEHIEREGGDVQAFVDRAKDKKDNSRLMGFGHRVYKNFDPRATILKKACTDVMNALGVRSRQLEIALRLEDIALNDDYFVSHRLYPNVDFYSGIIYKAIGIPVNMFTVLFAIGRMPGWIAQWMEMRGDRETKIARPRQIYVGPTERAYVPMERRPG
jgi:citrate synthase